jgi:hypothetical protein
MTQDPDARGPSAAEQALAVMLRGAENSDLREDHELVYAYCDTEVLTKFVDLAWRHQFEEDRSQFKRDLKELQEYVSKKYSERA